MNCRGWWDRSRGLTLARARVAVLLTQVHPTTLSACRLAWRRRVLALGRATGWWDRSRGRILARARVAVLLPSPNHLACLQARVKPAGARLGAG